MKKTNAPQRLRALARTVLPLLAACLAPLVQAQMPMISQLSNSPSMAAHIGGEGQSFTATATTAIRRISVRPGLGFNATLYLYNGGQGSGSTGNLGTPAYTQTGLVLPNGASDAPPHDIVLTTPFPVAVGSAYTFMLKGTSGNPPLYVDLDGNPYTDGQRIFNYADTSRLNDDLAFQIWTTWTQTVAFTSSPPMAYVGDNYGPAVQATSGLTPVVSIGPGSGGVCELLHGTVRFTGTGTCTIRANQPGNDDYEPAAQVAQSFTVAATPSYTVGGTVTGLAAGQSLTLRNAINDNTLSISANGPFTLGQPVARHGSYNVQTHTQPNGQTCNVAWGAHGSVTGDVTSVRVTCHTLAADNCTAGSNARGNYILGDAQGAPAAMHWESGLVWKRCAEGQGWDSATQQCTGTRSTRNWADWAGTNARLPLAFDGQDGWGVNLPASHNLLTGGDWRMAYREELLGITEGCGASPTLNRFVFPETLPLVGLWSASPYAQLGLNVWFVNFDQGFPGQYQGINMATRLVRGGRPFAAVPDQAHTSPAGQAGPVELPSVTLAANAPGQAWGGARISGDGSPEFRVGNGPWVTEAIVASGDQITVRLTPPASLRSKARAALAGHSATLVLRSGQASGTSAQAANGGDEATAMQETRARFSVTAAPVGPAAEPVPVPVLQPWMLALLGALVGLLALRRTW